MRAPANRRKGAATRDIGGYSCHDTSRIVSLVGLTLAVGGDGARITSRIFFGGWLYPDSPLTGTAGAGVAPFEDEFGGTGAALAASVATKIKGKASWADINSLRLDLSAKKDTIYLVCLNKEKKFRVVASATSSTEIPRNAAMCSATCFTYPG